MFLQDFSIPNWLELYHQLKSIATPVNPSAVMKAVIVWMVELPPVALLELPPVASGQTALNCWRKLK